MFQAILIACVISNPTSCMKVLDTYGPYEGQSRCYTRLEEMQYKLEVLWKKHDMPLTINQTMCIVVQGERT